MQDDLFSPVEGPQWEIMSPEPGVHLAYCRQWLAQTEADTLLQTFESQLPWEQPDIFIAGKRLPIPRLQCWYGDREAVLRYSGQTFQPQPWISELDALRARLHTTLPQADLQLRNRQFNSVLINLYRDGNDSVSWHADDEYELGPQPVIASLSLGETRTFQLKPKAVYRDSRPPGEVGARRLDIPLSHGDLLVMYGNCQARWQHCLPKSRRQLGPRINLTFRWIVPEGEITSLR